MNQELITSFSCGIAGLSTVLAATLYTIGGRDNTPKAIRRFGSPICVLGGLISILAITSRLTLENATYAILASIALCIGYCMGYGGNDLKTKLKKRGAIAAMYMIAFLLLTYVPYLSKSFLTATVFMHICNCLLTIVLGITNPFKAAEEEFWIGLLSCSMIMTYLVR